MSEARVAARYATSLFDLGSEQNILDNIMEDAQSFIAVCMENRSFDIMLKSPVIQSDKKMDVMERLFGKAFQKTTMAFIKIVLRKNRSFVLRLIFQQFSELYRDYKGIVTATVYTAMPVGDEVKEQINTFLKKQTNKTIELHTGIEPELIGGFVLRYNDKLLDASVSTQLKTLRHHLIHNN
jgi:F-type H+-transporting ATPase subunit delta